jgi:hypothetical protein
MECITIMRLISWNHSHGGETVGLPLGFLKIKSKDLERNHWSIYYLTSTIIDRGDNL